MARKRAPIRWHIVEEVRNFLRDLDLEDATNQVKMFHVYRKRTHMNKGLTFMENCVIFHEDKVYTDPKTGETIPDQWGMMHTRQDLKEFRKKMKFTTIVLYCLTDKITGISYYFNIPTIELFQVVVRRMDKIIKGILENKIEALKILGMNRKDRTKLAKANANQLRRAYLEKAKRHLSKERKNELDIIRKKFDEMMKQQLKESEETDRDLTPKQKEEKYNMIADKILKDIEDELKRLRSERKKKEDEDEKGDWRSKDV